MKNLEILILVGAGLWLWSQRGKARAEPAAATTRTYNIRELYPSVPEPVAKRVEETTTEMGIPPEARLSVYETLTEGYR